MGDGSPPTRMKHGRWSLVGYNVHRNSYGDIVRYKAKLVAKCFVQKYDIEYDEVFALVARMETIDVLLALIAQE